MEGAARLPADEVLGEERNAPERAVGLGARRVAGIERRGPLPSPVEVEVDDRVQGVVERLQPLDGGGGELARRDLTPAEQIGLGGGVEPAEIVHAPDAMRSLGFSFGDAGACGPAGR